MVTSNTNQEVPSLSHAAIFLRKDRSLAGRCLRGLTCSHPPLRSPECSAARLSQHADQHRSEHPVLLAVEQQLSEGPALRVAPELSDPVGPLEVGEQEDVE